MWILTTGTQAVLLRYYQVSVAERRAKGTLLFQSVKLRTERKAPKSRTGVVRICGGAMDFDVDFNNGDEGNTLAVLSSPRC